MTMPAWHAVPWCARCTAAKVCSRPRPCLCTSRRWRRWSSFRHRRWPISGAEQSGSQALRKPQVLAFGTREVNTQGKPNWVAGMAVRWTLWDSIDRDKLAAAGQRSVEQAELTDQQVRSDIALLVEKNWLALEQARTRYQSGQAQEDLARELLRLRTAGLKEGTSTSLELIDAQLNVAKVQTERASAANDYVQALAALLESTGQTDALEQYMAREDILMTSDAP